MYYIRGAGRHREDRLGTHSDSVRRKEEPLSGIQYFFLLDISQAELSAEDRRLCCFLKGLDYHERMNLDFSMNRLLDQLYATNMVRRAEGVCVSVYVCLLVL